MLYAILFIMALVAVTFYNRGTASLNLVVRELFTMLGFVAGATPETIRTTVNVVKANNNAAVEHLARTGVEAPRGFREGAAKGVVFAEDFFADANAWAAELEAETTAKEAARKAETTEEVEEA